MSGKAARIVLTEQQKAELENIIQSRIAQQRWVDRQFRIHPETFFLPKSDRDDFRDHQPASDQTW